MNRSQLEFEIGGYIMHNSTRAVTCTAISCMASVIARRPGELEKFGKFSGIKIDVRAFTNLSSANTLSDQLLEEVAKDLREFCKERARVLVGKSDKILANLYTASAAIGDRDS